MNNKIIPKFTFIAGGIVLFCLLLITLQSYIHLPLGIHFYSVQTGSMVPVINEGSLIITLRIPTYQINDIITYESVQSGQAVPITHRIINISTINENLFYQTKGDANSAPDVDLIDSKDIIGKVFVRIPLIGHIFSFIRTPMGFLFMVMIPAGVIMFDELKTIIGEIQKLKLSRN